jgi:hypothetical protein
VADKKGGKQAGPDDIMTHAEIKAVLAFAKRGDPASCAIALTKDKDGVLLLDKKRKPKAVLNELKKKAGAAGLELETTSFRFGRAVVDTENDPGLLSLVINKDSPGVMRPKLLERVKKAGFMKLELTVDTALEVEEPASPEPSEDSPAPPARAGEAEAAPAPPAAPTEPEAAEAPAAAAPPDAAAAQPAPPEAAPAAAQPDMSGLTRALTDLVRQIVPIFQADQTRGQALRDMATAAQTALRNGDAAGAGRLIAQLTDAVRNVAPAPPVSGAAAQASPAAPPNGPGATAFAKARLAWVATRHKIEGEIDKLHAEMTSVYKDHGFGADLDKIFRTKVDPMLDKLDHRLAEKLDEVAKNGDPAGHAKLVQEAKTIIRDYESYIAGEPLIAKLDDNPFVPLQIQKTLSATLAALSKVVA